MEEDQMELTSKQVAAIFGVKPGTVSHWVAVKRLAGTMPRKARRTGRRFRVSAVRQFAQEAGDDGYSESQLDRWLEMHREEIKSTGNPGISRTPVLSSQA